MTQTTVYMVTGANRGIGLALVKEIVSKFPDIAIFAGVREPSSASALKEVAAEHPGKIEIVKFVSGDESVNKAIAQTIKNKHGHVDVVIGCGAIADYMGSAFETPPKAMREHLEVNTTGILVLFQSMYELLKESKSSPKFIPFTSAAASLSAFISLPAGYTCYGASKAALNYIARKIHFENEWLICFPLSPGIVDTDMAASNRAMDKTGSLAPLQDAMKISAEEAATTLSKIIVNATREKEGGEFINIDGNKFTW